MLYAIRILLVFALFLLPCFTPRGHSADATSFDPTKIPVQAKGTIPIGTVIAWTSVTNPSDMEKWLDCNGQGVSQSVYPELYAVVGARVPDMRNQFLRGGTVAQVRQTAADTTRSHYHGQPSHTHSVDARLTSTAVSGTAAGQKYYDMKSGNSKYLSDSVVQGSSDFKKHVNNIFPGISSYAETYTFSRTSTSEGLHVINNSTIAHGSMSGSAGESSVTVSGSVNVPGTTGKTEGANTKWIVDGGADYAEQSSVAAQVNNGSSTGTANASGNDNTYENSNNDGTKGGTETAPQHMRVRYLIRALQ